MARLASSNAASYLPSFCEEERNNEKCELLMRQRHLPTTVRPSHLPPPWQPHPHEEKTQATYQQGGRTIGIDHIGIRCILFEILCVTPSSFLPLSSFVRFIALQFELQIQQCKKVNNSRCKQCEKEQRWLPLRL